jgi:hypothetical protein
MSLDWQEITTAPQQEGLLLTSEHFPGWFVVGWRCALGEWHVETGQDPLPHHPTHYVRLSAVPRRRMS